MQFDVLALGSLTVDQFIVPKEMGVMCANGQYGEEEYLTLPVGAKIQLDRVFDHVGGCAANVSVGFARLGLRSACLGAVGNDKLADQIFDALDKENVHTEYIVREAGGATTFSVVILLPDGRRTILYQRNLSPHFTRETLYNAPPARGLYVSHVYDTAEELLFEIPYFKGSGGEWVTWNPGRTQFTKGIARYEAMVSSVDCMILNIEEAEEFFHTPLELVDIAQLTTVGLQSDVSGREIYDVRPVVQIYHELGGQGIIITDGGRGAQYVSAGGEWIHQAGSSVPPVSTIGAGDSFGCGVTAAALLGHDPQMQMRWGGANAESVITEFGAQNGLLRRADMPK